MPTHVALLRGINVGGRNRVTMADLRDVMLGLGHTEVTTYIQSGNVVFTPGAHGDRPELADGIERAVEERLLFKPPVIVLSRAELGLIVRNNPYPDAETSKRLHAIFLPVDPGPEIIEGLVDAQGVAVAKGSRDVGVLQGRVLYLRTPDGLGNSVLAEHLARRGRAGAVGPTRNWTTVGKLLDLCDA